LVANFTDEKGNTSVLGIQLAEEASKDDSFVANHIRTTPRPMLQSYLVSQRIPSKALKEVDAARWLAREFSADAVLVGQIKREGSNLKLELQLLESHRSLKSKAERGALPGLSSPADLAPNEPFGQLPEVTIDGEKVPELRAKQSAGLSEMTVPSCMYQPDPPYSESARQSKYQGILILQTVISKEGRILDVRPLLGAPYGLNAVSVATVRTWRCAPSKVAGNPVSVVVPIEISFRLF
jgi:hypothetical protein